jgi:HAD superfamily hydrolase (TIGR01509 family)
MTDQGARRGVIWDVDGTLFDSSAYHKQAWKRALANVGYDMTDDDFARTFGLRNDSIMRMLLGKDVAADTIQRVETAKEADYRGQVREHGIELLPGVRHWLDKLRGDGWHQSIGSSAPKANVELVLEATGTAGYFEAVITGADVSKGKPDPEVYLTAAAKLGVVIRRCVVIEDAPEAVQGSLRAGIKTVAVRSDGRQGADLEVATMDQLPADAFDRLVPVSP